MVTSDNSVAVWDQQKIPNISSILMHVCKRSQDVYVASVTFAAFSQLQRATDVALTFNRSSDRPGVEWASF